MEKLFGNLNIFTFPFELITAAATTAKPITYFDLRLKNVYQTPNCVCTSKFQSCSKPKYVCCAFHLLCVVCNACGLGLEIRFTISSIHSSIHASMHPSVQHWLVLQHRTLVIQNICRNVENSQFSINAAVNKTASAFAFAFTIQPFEILQPAI